MVVIEAANTKLVDENHKLWSANGRLRAMVFTTISEVAAIQVKFGMEKPRRKAAAAGRQPLKMVAIGLGFSQSGLRKRALRSQATDNPIGEMVGGRWFVDPALVMPKR